MTARRKQKSPRRHVSYEYKCGQDIDLGRCKYRYIKNADYCRSPLYRTGVGYRGILTPYKSRDHVRRYIYSDDSD